MEIKKYSGFLCKKCKTIPLFQIIYKNNEIKIFSACNCHKQYETIDSFLKNKYFNDIPELNIISNKSFLFSLDNTQIKSEEKFDICNILKDFIKSKEKMNESANKIKNELISIYQKKLEEIKDIYDKYISNNNKIILVIEKLINSYQLFKDNPSIMENMKNNCLFNNKFEVNNLLKEYYSSIDSSFKIIENYFNKELIISFNNRSPLYKRIESRYYPSSNDYINCFIQLDDDICASCSEKDNNIVIYDLKNEVKEKIIFRAHLKNIYSMIKSYKNNIISIGDDSLIKIWPIISKYLLLEAKKQFDIENKNKIKFYPTISYKKIELKLNPIFIFNYEHNINMKMEKMINLENNNFLISSKSSIDIYKYEINNNIDFQIKKINNYEHDNILNICILHIKEKEAIALLCKTYIDFLYLKEFIFINKINIRHLILKNSLLQLNSQELLIVDTSYNFNIYNINNFEFILKIKNYNDIDFLLNLNDGTFIVSCFEGIKRYLIKTMEELPQLINFNNNNYYEDYDYYDYDYDYYRETVTFLYELKDKRIVACHKEGTIDILNLKF